MTYQFIPSNRCACGQWVQCPGDARCQACAESGPPAFGDFLRVGDPTPSSQSFQPCDQCGKSDPSGVLVCVIGSVTGDPSHTWICGPCFDGPEPEEYDAEPDAGW